MKTILLISFLIIVPFIVPAQPMTNRFDALQVGMYIMGTNIVGGTTWSITSQYGEGHFGNTYWDRWGLFTTIEMMSKSILMQDPNDISIYALNIKPNFISVGETNGLNRPGTIDVFNGLDTFPVIKLDGSIGGIQSQNISLVDGSDTGLITIASDGFHFNSSAYFTGSMNASSNVLWVTNVVWVTNSFYADTATNWLGVANSNNYNGTFTGDGSSLKFQGNVTIGGTLTATNFNLSGAIRIPDLYATNFHWPGANGKWYSLVVDTNNPSMFKEVTP